MISHEEFYKFLFIDCKNTIGNEVYKLNTQGFYSVINKDEMWNNASLETKIIILLFFRAFPFTIEREIAENSYKKFVQMINCEISENDIEKIRQYEYNVKFN